LTQPETDSSIHRNPETLQHLYGERFSGQSEYRNEVWRRITSGYLAQWIPSSATVLDLGAGHCEFINNVSAAKKFALDLNPDAAKAANADVQLVLHDCTKEWPLPAASIDVVFTSNFLEHLPDKDAVIEACRQAHRVLKPGGRLVAIGPNARFVGGKYWDYFDHHIPLTERSLGEALAATGFDVTKSIGRFLPYTMSGNRQRPVALVSAYLRLPAAWKLLGEQFLVVARRPVG
jgi:SAM-dependent methyltransferase